MGLISAALGTGLGVLADQWKEYFYADAIPADTLVVKGRKKTTMKSANYSTDNIITSGSIISVADGQCMMIVEQGQIVELCTEPGEYKFDASSEPSIFDNGTLAGNAKAVWENLKKRFTFGGEAPKEQRIYYFNTKEMPGQKYGTPNPVPFRVVDERAGIDMDISIRCFGEYSIRLTNPMLFYTNVCGNIKGNYTMDDLDAQMKSELLTALGPAFAKISAQGIRYSELPAQQLALADALNEVLSSKWRDLRGIEIVSFGVSTVNASEEDQKLIKDMQRNAAFKDPATAAAYIIGQQGEAMTAAANNANGAAMGFMGLNMAQNAGGANAQALYGMAQQAQQPAQPGPASSMGGATWYCPKCGRQNDGNFCPACGTAKPAL